MTEILVVDDDQSLLKSMTRGIETISPPLSVLSAGNGLEAIGLLKKNSVRLMVTDLKMPQMDGFELLAYVMEHYPDIPVIVTTGHSIPESKRETLKEATLFVLFKPFALEELKQSVSHLLDKQADGGTLFNVSPGMFLQLINMEQKTCTLRIQERNSEKMGVLFFRKGKLLDARMGDLQGEQATLEIFSWDHISLSIQNDCPLQDLKINRSMNALILESARLKDERADISTPASPEPSSESLENSSETKEDIQERDALEHQLAEISNRLQKNSEFNALIQNISHDKRWSGLLSQFIQVGGLLNAGRLKAFSIITGSDMDYVIIPSNPPTVLTVHMKCPKEKLYQALE